MKAPLIYPFDTRRRIALPGDHDDALEFAVQHFITCATEAISKHGSFFVALSGGSTPKKIFELLTSPLYSKTVDWEKVFLFWSDERSVPPSDKDSNYKMAMDAGFNKLPIPNHQIFRMHAEFEIEKNAINYENLIKNTLKERPFDLIMLGMGDDGHTASLFPHTDALHVKDHLVVANFIREKNTMRMTFTFPLINRALHAVFYVLGESKADRVKSVFCDPTNGFPSSKVGTPERPALWIFDDAASKKLLEVCPLKNGHKRKIS